VRLPHTQGGILEASQCPFLPALQIRSLFFFGVSGWFFVSVYSREGRACCNQTAVRRRGPVAPRCRTPFGYLRIRRLFASFLKALRFVGSRVLVNRDMLWTSLGDLLDISSTSLAPLLNTPPSYVEKTAKYQIFVLGLQT